MRSKLTDSREGLAKRLWDRGFGSDPSVDAENFKEYLAGIPQIPMSLLAENPDLPLLSLCDPRPGLLRVCRLLGIQHEGLAYSRVIPYYEGDVVPFDGRFPLPTVPFWFRHDDGHASRGRRPDHCRAELVSDILAGTAMEGIFAYAHHPDIVVEGKHILDLPRTVLRSVRADGAYLKVWLGQVRLSGRDSRYAYPNCGTLRVRRK